MLERYTLPHQANIAVHVLAAVTAIAAGLLAVFASKGGRLHARSGYTFIWAYVAVFATAVLGVTVFQFRSFLAVATIASTYSVFSGYRALRLHGERPRALDCAVAWTALAAPLIFVAGMHWLHQPWSPALTWSVLGGLIAVSSYDLLRSVLPLAWLRRVWRQEHLLKMINALEALLATGAATLLPRYQPWAALVPVLAGTAVAVGFLIAGPRVWQAPPQPSRE